jgi:hypothetical protein
MKYLSRGDASPMRMKALMLMMLTLIEVRNKWHQSMPAIASAMTGKVLVKASQQWSPDKAAMTVMFDISRKRLLHRSTSTYGTDFTQTTLPHPSRNWSIWAIVSSCDSHLQAADKDDRDAAGYLDTALTIRL